MATSGSSGGQTDLVGPAEDLRGSGSMGTGNRKELEG